jgi:Domain of unknown function (DUF4156)
MQASRGCGDAARQRRVAAAIAKLAYRGNLMHKTMRKTVLLFAALTTLAGCTWVKLEDTGAHVRVAYDGRVDGCEKAGEVSTSVKHKVGVYDRNDLKVKDELETLARNEAAGLPADTIVPRGEPHDGAQAFTAYRCGSMRSSSPRRDAPPPPREQGGAETYPVR